MKEFAAVEWDRARRAMKSTNLLLEEDPEASASRSYYAAFYAVTALFALDGKTYTKHSGIRAAVHRELVKAGRLTQECGGDYDYLLDLRGEADYGEVSTVSLEDARIAVEKAAGILDALRRSCPGLKEGGS